MPPFEWLPSERAWLDQLTERILTGDVLVVRSIPRWGLSSACSTIAQMLGDSALIVEGRAITEQTQKTSRESIDSNVAHAIERAGCAQLIFDDYGRAIRRSQGGTLHSMLFRLLIDSAPARDTGALLVARSGDMLDLNFSGSPLLSRAQVVALPTLQSVDADALCMKLSTLQQLVGESTWLARRFANATEREGRLSAVEHLNHDRRRLVEALPPAAVEVLAGARHARDADPISREALLCLGRYELGMEFKPAELVSQSKLLDEVRMMNPGWPSSAENSVLRFAELLAGASDAIWVDRYLFSRPTLVRTFIDFLRNTTATRLRLLVSADRDRPNLAGDIRAALDGVGAVEVRFMNRGDRPRLHDRHLVLPALRSGFVLPTAGVILGADDPGSAVAVPMPTLAIDYAECWNRAAIVFQVT